MSAYANLPLATSLGENEDYDELLASGQYEMLKIQRAYYHQQRRAVIVFEGWDAAGKGGTIRRLTSPLDPRGFRVHMIGAPYPQEQGRHYMYRFWRRLPKPGSLAIFDRSWYGRVLVERVDQLIATATWQRAYDEINEFESLLQRDGVRICKVFLNISRAEQLRRFHARYQNPEKRWKLTVDDFRCYAQREQYEEAIAEMLRRTSPPECPWKVIGADRKKPARIEALRHVCQTLKADVTISDPDVAPGVADLADEAFRALR